MCEGLTAWGPPSIRGFLSSVQLRDLLGFIYINHQGYWGGGGGGWNKRQYGPHVLTSFIKKKQGHIKRGLCIYTLALKALKSSKAGFNLYRNKVELIFSIRTKIPITSRDKGLEVLSISRRSLHSYK